MSRPKKKATPPPAIVEDAEALDPSIFKLMKQFLKRFYVSSRKAQTIILSPESYRANSRNLDGCGGSALLMEFLSRVLGHTGLMPQREICKRLMLAAAWSLKMPISVGPNGALSVGLRPSGQQPRVAKIMLNLLSLLPLPSGVIELVSEFCGSEIWFGVQPCDVQQLCRSSKSFALELGEASRRSRLRKILPWPCCTMFFSDETSSIAELDVGSQVIWLQAESLWPLISLMRHRRARYGMSSTTTIIRGFGEVLI